jgi:hypothetical protein
MKTDGLNLKTLVDVKACGLNVSDGARGASDPRNVAMYKRFEKPCTRPRRARLNEHDGQTVVGAGLVQVSARTSVGFDVRRRSGRAKPTWGRHVPTHGQTIASEVNENAGSASIWPQDMRVAVRQQSLLSSVSHTDVARTKESENGANVEQEEQPGAATSAQRQDHVEAGPVGSVQHRQSSIQSFKNNTLKPGKMSEPWFVTHFRRQVDEIVRGQKQDVRGSDANATTRALVFKGQVVHMHVPDSAMAEDLFPLESSYSRHSLHEETRPTEGRQGMHAVEAPAGAPADEAAEELSDTHSGAGNNDKTMVSARLAREMIRAGSGPGKFAADTADGKRHTLHNSGAPRGLVQHKYTGRRRQGDAFRKTHDDVILTADIDEVVYMDTLGPHRGYPQWVHRCVMHL